jgi:hypothetical protein
MHLTTCIARNTVLVAHAGSTLATYSRRVPTSHGRTAAFSSSERVTDPTANKDSNTEMHAFSSADWAVAKIWSVVITCPIRKSLINPLIKPLAPQQKKIRHPVFCAVSSDKLLCVNQSTIRIKRRRSAHRWTICEILTYRHVHLFFIITLGTLLQW